MVKVKASNHFKQQYLSLSEFARKKIFLFIKHLEEKGFDGLEGRNKNSDNVDKNDREWLTKVQFASKHKLWHYHIGIPRYEGIFGDKTSEHIIHYQKFPDEVNLVDFGKHPFKMPDEDKI